VKTGSDDLKYRLQEKKSILSLSSKHIYLRWFFSKYAGDVMFLLMAIFNSSRPNIQKFKASISLMIASKHFMTSAVMEMMGNHDDYFIRYK
jgi:hypothetical protein